MFPRANTIFLQLCFVFLFADAIENYGAMSTGEIHHLNYRKCFEYGGHLRNYQGNGTTTKIIRCEIAHNYYCLQTQVITSPEELSALNELKCVELHADLIINQFHSNSSHDRLREALSRIRKIRGRLIINGNHFPDQIIFDKLEEVGDSVFMGQSPVIQITSNRVNAIRLPLLKKIHCLKNKRRKCVVIGGNVEVAGSSQAQVSKNSRNLNVIGHFLTEMETEEEVVEVVEESTEPDWMILDSDEIEGHRNVEDLTSHFFITDRHVHGIVALVFLFAAAIVLILTVCQLKRKELRLLSNKYEYKDNWGRASRE